VEDFRDVNNATEDDGHPLPRIEGILQKQGEYKMWSTLDLKDGYHQMPLKPEHRYITCMSTPRGTMQWNVLVMGLKNGNAMFQRMMEWVLRDHPYADPYVDDIIIGSTADTPENLLVEHEKNVRAVLETLKKYELVAEFSKARLFMKEVEFCGHVLREGRRGPAPGKLLSIQGWELPKTVTQLRGFLGLTNYYSCYVKNYAEFAAPLMSKLQLNREDGKKGSQKPIRWTTEDVESFVALKKALAEELELFHLEPDQPFVMKTDPSDQAIGAVLEQHRNGKVVPVAFFSRKLGGSQLNWTPREKESYAIVSSLRKWAGWIGFQPILIQTDHRSIEDWVTEHVDTPSGPRGRRARWHETLSQFNLEIQYMPGKDNIVADAMSRYAYPASSAREDVSFHGSATAREEMKKIIEKEIREGRMVALLQMGKMEPEKNTRNLGRIHIVGGTIATEQIATHVRIVQGNFDRRNSQEPKVEPTQASLNPIQTRSGIIVGDSESEEIPTPIVPDANVCLGLTWEEWNKARCEGLSSVSTVNLPARITFPKTPNWETADVILEINIPKCLENGYLFFNDDKEGYYACSGDGDFFIPPDYFFRALSTVDAKVIFPEEDIPSSSAPPKGGPVPTTQTIFQVPNRPPRA
jgi:hypothetical protein